MRKLAIILFMLITVFMITGCNKKEPKVVITNAYYDHAINQMELIYDYFYYENANTFSGFSPQDPDPNSNFKGGASLWGYGGMLTAISAGALVDPQNETIRTYADLLVEGLASYRYPVKQLYYTSNIRGGEPYYDDNAWIVLGLYELGKTYNDDTYIEHSRELLNYVMSGESPDGGVFWKETVTSRNTCSTAPTIIAALLHYQNNPEAELLEFAIRNYNWTVDTLKDPTDHVYWDNATMDEFGVERIEKTKWTYNSGTMIWASVLLYEITGEATYLTEAERTASGALAFFYRGNQGVFNYPVSPWFNMYLLRGFIELAKSKDDGSVDYMINTFVTSMNNAILKGKDDRGLILRSWGSGNSVATDQFLDLLDASATTEILFLIAYYQINLEVDS